MLFTEVNLKNYRINKSGNFYNTIKQHIKYYCYACNKCGYPYLGKKVNRGYCSNKCANENHRGTAHWNYGKHRPITTREKIKANHRDVSGSKNPRWNNGVTHANVSLYDTYAPQLEPYEQCRRSNIDPNILEVKCVYCGKWYMPTRMSINSRIHQGIKGNDTHKLYCSKECKQECPIYGKQKYYKGQSGYSSREVQPQLRQLVFTRDNYICQKCSSVGPLHCHHIDPVASNPIESADVDNCVTLCKQCHKETHQLPGCGYSEIRKC